MNCSYPTQIYCKQINPKSILYSLEKTDINRVQGGYGYTGNNPVIQY